MTYYMSANYTRCCMDKCFKFMETIEQGAYLWSPAQSIITSRGCYNYMCLLIIKPILQIP